MLVPWGAQEVGRTEVARQLRNGWVGRLWPTTAARRTARSPNGGEAVNVWKQPTVGSDDICHILQFFSNKQWWKHTSQLTRFLWFKKHNTSKNGDDMHRAKRGDNTDIKVEPTARWGYHPQRKLPKLWKWDEKATTPFLLSKIKIGLEKSKIML